ncbi:flowering time control protein FPA [Lotus japonicus]|uniref:flowering time control protein FPA n=1 Tax=Lotus japonicus TaxID=34305 RepID=UPI0025911C7B|nr:flowering time control protein FPA [Lotus japonicus]XP_057456302.1 flowering time control protein FPA [Lotus japonicus]
MPPPAKSTPRPPSQEGGEDSSVSPSNNLWVGNLAPDVTDSDLMDLFAQYGALDSVTCYTSRSYAFVFFKRVDDAKAAKNALQGFSLRGVSLKIEFAFPAKPCKQLWVGGISPAVTREDLEAEFHKFGKLEDFKFFRDRNTACVEFFNLDDATQAMKIMNGKRIGGEQIRVDFLRSNSTKRDQLPDYGQFQGKSMGPTDSYSGQKRPLHSPPLMGRKGDHIPSNILWIGYPPAVQIDEQMLHNAMILFGEIERIRSFPSKNHALVEFRSVDEARRAKEGLQGRLFNDPRITITYSSSDPVPGKDYPTFYPGSNGPRPDMFLNEHPFQPFQMDLIGHNRPMVPNSFPGQLPHSGIVGPNIPMRPFGAQGGLDSGVSGPEFNDISSLHQFQDGSSMSKIGPNWKRPSPPAQGILPSPTPGVRLPTRSASGAWDVLDINHIPRDPKRSRIDGTPLRNIDDRGFALEQQYGNNPVIDGGGSDPYMNMQGKSHIGPVSTRITAGVHGSGQPDIDHIWRGVLAKGGTPVCRARCVPVGKGIGAELPDVVDCSARTGLDILSKHYADAIGFEIVFFLPDSEEDFASYTEFLRYLKAKNRAGVAKFADNNTLFLVPPSDFLTDILKVTGPERLYGVVLKFPSLPNSTPMQESSHLPIPSTQYMQQIPPSQAEYGMIPSKEERFLQADYNRSLHDDSKLFAKPIATGGPPPVQSMPSEYAPNTTVSGSQAAVGLTPELIATLASFLPANAQSSAPDGANPAGGSLNVKPPFPPSAPNDGNQSHLWKQDHQIADQSIYPPPQFRSMYNFNNGHYQSYPPAPAPGHPAQLVSGSSHIQDSAVGMQQPGAVSSTYMSNFATPSHNGQSAVSSHVNQQYQVDASPSTQRGFGVAQGTDASVLYNSQAFQQPNSNSQAFQPPNNSMSYSNQVNSANPSQQPTGIPYAVGQINSDAPNQQLPVFGAGQGTSEVEADKNQRYQSTLQFAANLLLQIQQQQQTQGGNGPGVQQ